MAGGGALRGGFRVGWAPGVRGVGTEEIGATPNLSPNLWPFTLSLPLFIQIPQISENAFEYSNQRKVNAVAKLDRGGVGRMKP